MKTKKSVWRNGGSRFPVPDGAACSAEWKSLFQMQIEIAQEFVSHFSDGGVKNAVSLAKRAGHPNGALTKGGTMKRTVGSLVFLTVVLFAFLPAAPAEKPPYLFFVQQDMRPAMDGFGFEEGFASLVKALPPDRQLAFVSNYNNVVTVNYEGTVGQFVWPQGFHFLSVSPATTPYKNLYKYLQEKAVHDTTVYVVSSGVSQDLLQLCSGSDLAPQAARPTACRHTTVSSASEDEGYSFLPNRYPTIPDIVKYCKKNKVRLVGFFVPQGLGVAESQASTLFRDAFLYTMNSTKGQAYWNFTSFQGIFQSALKKHFPK